MYTPDIKDPHLMKLEKPKTSGLNHLWDGPLDTTGYPMKPGASNGKNGMKLKRDCNCEPHLSMPITQRAKMR